MNNIESERIELYNPFNKIITLNDVVILFKKFDMIVEPKNINYYINSLTHVSYIKNNNNEQSYLYDKSNERFEFLGDTVIKCVISGYLFNRYQNEDEGFMTRLKTKLENTETLSKMAKIMGINEYIIISKQIEDNGGRLFDKILEDAFESFVGALYLDVGFEVCRTFIIMILENEIDYSQLLYMDTNYKDQLLRFYHKNKWSFPVYELLESSFVDGKHIYKVGVKGNNNIIIAKGTANTKQKAEQLASMYALYDFGLLQNDQLIL